MIFKIENNKIVEVDEFENENDIVNANDNSVDGVKYITIDKKQLPVYDDRYKTYYKLDMFGNIVIDYKVTEKHIAEERFKKLEILLAELYLDLDKLFIDKPYIKDPDVIKGTGR